MKKNHAEVVVIGAGPGGYAAAFYAADMGKKTVLIEKAELGGVCLNRGCIPSKALLHATEVMSEAKESAARGITFAEPKVDLDKLRSWKQAILTKLSDGVGSMAKAHKVEVIKARAVFDDSQTLRLETEKGQSYLTFDKAILAVGSRPAMPAVFDLGSKRIMTSTEALEIEDVPGELLVIGGGYIGMELGTVYAKLGSAVTVVEAMSQLLGGADQDLVRPVKKFAETHFKEVMVGTKVLKMASKGKKVNVSFEKDGEKSEQQFDKVLVSVGRTPNSQDIGIENTKIKLDERGYVKVNDNLQTDDPNIFAIGDIAGGVLLAHKATMEARIAVESMLGFAATKTDAVVPAVVFTDPEVAWVGLTENEAKAQGIKVKVEKFPWGASGRAMTLDRTDGLTKLIIDPENDRILGVGMAGVGAGDMIAESALAIEMGATVEDIALTVHPHPTLAESLMEAAEKYVRKGLKTA